jgi:hypothetical protein
MIIRCEGFIPLSLLAVQPLLSRWEGLDNTHDRKDKKLPSKVSYQVG